MCLRVLEALAAGGDRKLCLNLVVCSFWPLFWRKEKISLLTPHFKKAVWDCTLWSWAQKTYQTPDEVPTNLIMGSLRMTSHMESRAFMFTSPSTKSGVWPLYVSLMLHIKVWAVMIRGISPLIKYPIRKLLGQGHAAFLLPDSCLSSPSSRQEDAWLSSGGAVNFPILTGAFVSLWLWWPWGPVCLGSHLAVVKATAAEQGNYVLSLVVAF